ncbi:hypothetical protein M8542_09270 [Amycolatopsis sp. OK19-0408]|uniref:Uncharacterized protein n=1 Tax=Amycolatopsis iheyensis TaxID=2945988 RepID=A0A9X2SIJ8_9PSEU|nr:hypothetical protein [Amycolatopsis iheyensis]MCR6483008.1 hypothetical protein [Amycolatopsis iheyensis]
MAVNIGSTGGKVAMPSFGAYSGAVRTKPTERGIVTAARLVEAKTPERQTRYAGLMKAFRATTRSWGTDGQPRARYLVGRDAAIMTRLTHLVSDRLPDRMVRSAMGL